MARRKLIYIIGSIAIGAIALLVVILSLVGSGVISTERNALVLSSSSQDFLYDGAKHSDDGWEIIEGQLKEGHTIEVVVSGEQTQIGSSVNHISAIIRDQNGADVTDNYNLTYKPGMLSVKETYASVASMDITQEYNGKALRDVKARVSVVELPEGYTAEGKFSATITDVGSVKNVFAATIYNDRGEDVTDSCKIDYDYGYLTVTPRKITVQTEDAIKIYDGNALACHAYTLLNGELAKDQTLKLEYTGSQLDAGESNNQATAKVINAKGKDVSGNYDIRMQYGVLKVERRPVTLGSQSAQKIYDGQPLTAPIVQLTSGSFVGEHTVKVSDTLDFTKCSQVEAGSSQNDCFGDLKILNGTTDVTNNYEITAYFGTLTVNKRPVKLLTQSAQKIYDGQPLTAQSATVENEAQNRGLLLAHEYNVTNYATITDAGNVKNTATATFTDGENDVTDNYIIDESGYGTLTVLPMEITVRAYSGTKVYDNSPMRTEGSCTANGCAAGCTTHSSFTVVSGEVVDGHTIYAKVSAYVDDQPYQVIDVVDGGYRTSVGEIVVTDGDEDVSGNYKFTRQDGLATVTPRPFNFTTGSGSKTYDGNALKVETIISYESDGGDSQRGLLDGDILGDNDDFASITYVGSVDNTVTVTVLRNGMNDVTDNYMPEPTYGTLTVTARTLTVKTEAKTKVYDATELSDGTYKLPYENTELIEGDRVQSVEKLGTITNVGNTLNAVGKVVIVNALGVDVSDSYTIVRAESFLTVTPRPVTLETHSHSWEYDEESTAMHRCHVCTHSILEWETCGGPCYKSALNLTQEQINNKIYYTSGNLIQGHKFSGVTFTGAIAANKVGTVPNTVNEPALKVLDANNDDVSDNYTITVIDGALTVYAGGGYSIGTEIPPDEQANTRILEYTSSYGGKIYFKGQNYANYGGNNWGTAQPITMTRNGQSVSSGYLTGEAAKTANFAAHSIEITMLESGGYYALPYYVVGGDDYGVVQTRDNVTNGSYAQKYKFSEFYPVDTNYLLSVTYGVEFDLDGESDVREAVRKQYLNIPTATKEGLLAIPRVSDLRDRYLADGSIVTAITGVIDYVSNAAPYNGKYFEYKLEIDGKEKSLNDSKDMAVEFLTTYKLGGGICQHFATSATMIFRAMGIPARYTVGCVGKGSVGELTTVTGDKAHAWAEVYVDGVGWVVAETTPGSGAPDNGEGEKDPESETIVVTPREIQLEYNDNGEYASYDRAVYELGLSDTLSGMQDVIEKNGLDAKYDYEVKYKTTARGLNETYISSLTLYRGGEVAQKYTVTVSGATTVESFIGELEYPLELRAGELKICTGVLNIATSLGIKYYDGTPINVQGSATIANGKRDAGDALVDKDGNVVGDTLSKEHLTFISQNETSAAFYANAVNQPIVVDKEGNDVTNFYYINNEVKVLEIKQCPLKLTVTDQEMAAQGMTDNSKEITLRGSALDYIDVQLNYTQDIDGKMNVEELIKDFSINVTLTNNGGIVKITAAKISYGGDDVTSNFALNYIS